MRKLSLFVACVALMLAGSSVALAANNDFFTNAYPIVGTSITTNSSNSGFTTAYETGEPGTIDGRNVRRSGWFSWTAPTNGLTRVDTIGSAFDTLLAAYTGVLPSLTLVAGNDNAYTGTTGSRVYFNATAGVTYKFTVSGISGVSGAGGIYVLRLQMLPATTLTMPTNGLALPAGSALALAATASSPNGTVSSVDFYRVGEGTYFQRDTTEPYEATYSSLALGTNRFYSVVTDSSSQLATSAVVNVIGTQAGVSVTSPTNGSSFFGTAPITVSASAASSTNIVSVEFFANAVKFGEDATAPYGVVWTNPQPGTYALRAIMNEQGGTSMTSAPVNVTIVGQSVVLAGSIWRYLDNGSDQGTDWQSSGFDDSAWLSGPAQLGYGDGDEATEICCSNAVSKFITAYFRHSFVVSNTAACTSLVSRVLRDDGAILYLNGVEAARYNMPAGTVNYLTATANATDDGTLFLPTNISPALLVEGTNVLAVELHQTSATSSDTGFDMELVAQFDPAFNVRPTVSLTQPPGGSVYLSGDSVPMAAAASDADGTVTKVEFFANTTKLGESLSPPYTFTQPNAPAGTYTLRAVATDDDLARSTSAPVVITVHAAVTTWVAINDQPAAGHTNDTAYSVSEFGTPSGPLKNIESGGELAASLIITNIPGMLDGGTMGAPWAGTPAYTNFTPYIDWTGGTSPGILMYSTNLIAYTFTNLHVDRRYRFTATTVRGGAPGGGSPNYYSNRWTQVELVGATSYQTGHSAGVITSNQFPGSLSGSQAAFCSGVNTNTGDVVEWKQIVPAPDGTFTVLSTKYVGEIPGGTASAVYAYGLTALRLEEFAGLVTIQLTSPQTNSFYLLPTNVTLTASLSGAAGGITNVVFLANGTEVASDTSSPYTVSWTPAAAGSYSLVAVALNNAGNNATSAVVSITVASNTPPVVGITTPLTGDVFAAPASILINAAASDDFGVAHVDFYQNGALLGQDASSPYSYLWTSVAAGIYQLEAVATDTHGLVSTSAVVTVTVTNDLPPLVTLTSPTNGSVFLNGVGIDFTATASDPDGVVARVEYFDGPTKLGESFTGPLYPFTWNGATAGGHQLVAVATDGAGMKGTSAPVNITVMGNQAPTVAITNPASGSFFSAPATLLVSASAADMDGTVTGVEFYTNAVLLGQAAAAPYTFVWTNVLAGSYTLTAVATDSGGLHTTSAPVNVIVTNVPLPLYISYDFSALPAASNWSTYSVAGAAATWTTSAQWDAGVAALSASVITAQVGNSNANPPTASTTAAWSSSGGYLQTRATGNNGTVLMATLLNGSSSPVSVVNISYDTTYAVTNSQTEDLPGHLAYYSMTGEAGSWVAIPALSLQPAGRLNTLLTLPSAWGVGSNLYLLWTDDNGPASPDWSVQIDNFQVVSDLVPRISLSAPPNGASVVFPTNLVLIASVSGYTNEITNVVFLADGNVAGGDAFSPYNTLWVMPAVGAHELLAVAQTSSGLSVTSAVVFVTVLSNEAPLVSISSPSDQASFPASYSVNITATASDDFGVSRVAFYQNGSLLGQDTSSPYAYNWTGISAGFYLLEAVATDVYGRTATSAPVNITVTNNALPVVSLTAPTNGQSFVAPATIALAATAVDPDGTVILVEFFGDGGKVGEDASEPFTTTWSSVIGGGNHTVFAVATDSVGQRATSAPVVITLEGDVPPTVSITSPTVGSTFPAPGNFTITAAASDVDGVVTNVSFYAGALFIGRDLTSPYNVVWANAPAGTYALTAVAWDSTGLFQTSAPVSVTIARMGVPVGVTYTFSNQPPVTEWSTYSITGSGSTYLDTNTMDAALVTIPATTVNQPLGVVTTNTTATLAQWNSVSRVVYTRPTGNAATVLMAKLVNNTLNALPALRVSYELGAHQPLASEETGALRAFYSLTGTAGSWTLIPEFSGTMTGALSATLTLGAWSVGSPLYLLWADDNNSVGTDGAWVFTNFLASVASGEFVTIASPGNNARVILPTNLVLSATTSGFTNAVTNVAFWNWPSTKLADVATEPFNYAWTTVTPGSYTLRAIALDSTGHAVTSAPVNITVQNNVAPSVAITAPAASSVFSSPGDITIQAAVGDTDGSVTNVLFLANDVPVGMDAAAPFSYRWQGVSPGTYDLSAVATDDHGAMSTSTVTRVFVILSTPPTVDSFSPAPGALSSFTALTVNFSQPVDGVRASDLLVNGVPATSVAGADNSYTFGFAQPRDGVVNVFWSLDHGIVNRENPPKPFSGLLTNEVVAYTLLDSIPPSVAVISPLPGTTLPSLTRLEVTFTEPVIGVFADSLYVNGVLATQVRGSLAGPYVFEFAQPAAGTVSITWDPFNDIRDYGSVINPLITSNWNYTLNPAANESGVVINELMYHPASENALEEYLELWNTNAFAVDLTGWRLSGGIDFVFPALSISGGSYLVVAANVAVFQAKYPGVMNVVGGWTGRLGNGGDTVRLRNALDDTVANVTYATEGDWAIRQRGPLDNGSRGWEWFAAHDGNVINTFTGGNEGGRSLELRNPALPWDNGQNWAASVPTNGTPGVANSVATNNLAPLIYDVTHSPSVPRSSDLVTISARIVDEQAAGLSVSLFYREHTTTSPGAVASTNLFDDGTHGDSVAGDGVFSVQLPALANGTVMEYYVAATDASALTRTWPAAARLETGAFVQQANAHYQVDDEVNSATMPMVRLIQTGTERAELVNITRASDAEMNTTIIITDGVDTKLRHNCGTRIRGAGSRNRPTPNYRINIPNDRKWNGLSEINLNTQYIHAQLAGSKLSIQSGLPAASVCVVQARANGVNYAPSGTPPQSNGDGAGFGACLLVEPINGEWAARHKPEDGNGNAYRGSTSAWSANLRNRGTDPNVYISDGYSKTSNQSDNDWTDLFALVQALNATNSPTYVQGVQQNVNVRLWMRYFAVCGIVNYWETSLCRGVGDDFAMYRGVVDPRFQIVPHDFDTILNEGDSRPADTTSHTIWSMLDQASTADTRKVHVLFPFMRHPEFAPVYYEELQKLLDTTFEPAAMNDLIDRSLKDFVSGTVIDRMKAFVAARHAYVSSQIPLALTINHALTTLSGYPRTATQNVALWGRANAIHTRSVLVDGQPATWSAIDAAWTNTVALRPGINRVLVQSLGSTGAPLDEATIDIWYDAPGTTVGGTISANTLWSAGSGPYTVASSLTVASGATLTIEPGATLYMGSGVNVTVANGGAILAEGTPTLPITITRLPGSATTWGGITINGVVGSPETRITHARIEFNSSTAIHSAGGTVFLDHLTFGNNAVQYLSLDDSSFVVSDCVFPSAAAGAYFELVHGNGGIKAGGRGLFLRNFFGVANSTSGDYNDVVDFSGGHRPGPIVQFINNVFVGTGDDLLDLDNTDAWIEGNIFMHAHKNGSPDTSSAISGGNDTGEPSEITIIGNLIYDCDHAVLAKQGNFYTLLNNTVVRQTFQGGTDTEGAVVCLADNNMSEGAGAYLEGNILHEVEALVQNRTNAAVTFTNNFMTLTWTGAGGGNSTNAPMLTYVPAITETSNFTSWASAQVLWQWFSLQPGSPAVGAGPNGRDAGALTAAGSAARVQGVSLSGEPGGITSQNSATLVVGLNRTGSSIPVTGFPDGSGFTHYQYRLDGGLWSADTPINTPITLIGLGNGAHRVEVVGRNDAGLYQNDSVLGADAAITASGWWIVNTNLQGLRINEILARNDSAVAAEGRHPDLIEIYNAGSATVDLTGMSISDSLDTPQKYVFPYQTLLAPGQFLVLYCDSEATPAGHHLGFTLKQDGDDVCLFAASGELLDSVTFGLQVADLSLGRLADGTWGLTRPTFGSVNVAQPLGDPRALRINEWLAAAQAVYPDDFLELHNTDSLPVALGGLYLTDIPDGAPGRHLIADLSFIAANGYTVFRADGNTSAGPEHLAFSLADECGEVALLDADWNEIDSVVYAMQHLDVSQGRSPNGSTNIMALALATPGAANPAAPPPLGTQLVLNEVLSRNVSGLTNFDGGTPEWIEIYNPTPGTISLAGMSLSDSFALPHKYIFSNTVSIPSLGRFVVLCDDNQPASSNNTGFGISANGGAVYLYDSASNQIDSIAYGVQARDYSIGRFPDGSTNWVLTEPTPASQNLAVSSLGNPLNLRVNEWMAAPSSGADWFEIYNPELQPVALAGFWLSDDISSPATRMRHPLPALSFIGSGLYGYERFWADNGAVAAPDHCNFALRAGGESIGISLPNGTLIDGYTFGPQSSGVSEGRLPDGTSNIVHFPKTSSPADANYLLLTNIVVNEVLSAVPTNGRFEQAIELRNVSDAPVDLRGWWLSNVRRGLQKFQFTNTTLLPAGGYLVVYEEQLTASEDETLKVWLDPWHGDQVYLAQAETNGALTGWRAEAEFGAGEPGVPFGRYITSTGDDRFVALSASTFGMDAPANLEEFRTGTGSANAYPRVGPLVLSEIMYRPPDFPGPIDNTRDEFVEILNITSDPVPLYDPLRPTNTWRLRGGVDFNFPPGLTLGAGERLVVVSFDPVTNAAGVAEFRTAYPMLPTNAFLVGPYIGKLDNGGEDVELQKPGEPVPAGQLDAGYVPYLMVEKVAYDDAGLWPTSPDGMGDSLHRFSRTGYANDVTNWLAAAPTPGINDAPAPPTNTPPVLGAIGDRDVTLGQTLSFTATASDDDVPAQNIAFALDAGFPAGAGIHSMTGAFSWTPTAGQAPGTYSLTVRVTDDGSPALDDWETITVRVWLPTTVTVSPGGQPNEMSVGFGTIAGKHYRVVSKDNLSEPTWAIRADNILGTGAPYSFVDDTTGVPQRFYRVIQLD